MVWTLLTAVPAQTFVLRGPPLRQLILPLFFFNATATTEIYTLSLHDALPICQPAIRAKAAGWILVPPSSKHFALRSEEHTSELQSQSNLVCRLLLEKKKHREASNQSDRR